MLFITKTRTMLACLSRTAALAGLYALLVTALLISADVTIRKIFGVAFLGVDELAGYALALATSWALSFAFFEGSHIRVNVFLLNMRSSLKAWLDVLAVLAMAALVGLLAWRVWAVAFDSWTFDAVSNTPLRLPLWIPQFLFLAGVLLFLVSAVVVFFESLILVLRRQYESAIHLVEEREQAGEYTL